MSCLACPAGYITLPKDKAMFKAPGGAWARESQNAERFPLPPLSIPLSSLTLQLLESPAQSAELEVETKTQG